MEDTSNVQNIYNEVIESVNKTIEYISNSETFYKEVNDLDILNKQNLEIVLGIFMKSVSENDYRYVKNMNVLAASLTPTLYAINRWPAFAIQDIKFLIENCMRILKYVYLKKEFPEPFMDHTNELEEVSDVCEKIKNITKEHTNDMLMELFGEMTSNLMSILINANINLKFRSE